jgi:NitT/TauT family transport system substrate-binding protein
MLIAQGRRRFVASAFAAGAAALAGSIRAPAEEGPPETTTVRLRFLVGPLEVVSGVTDTANCEAPLPVARELLAAEGFTDVRYVPVKSGPPYTQAFARGEIDFGFMFAPSIIRRVEAGAPIAALAGIHSGCLELFAHDYVRTFADLKGRQVGFDDVLGGASQLYVSVMAAHVGLDPDKDIRWVTADDVPRPIDLFMQGKIDAYLAFVPEPQDLRARRIGHVIVDMGHDKPWANYFCCMLVGRTEFVQKYPTATKRTLRAILKATDLCSAEPERIARRLIQGGFAQHYDIARQMLIDIPYATWRELDPEDTLRFYALWLYEHRDLRSSPNAIIGKSADWRFLDQVKRELKT